MATDTEKAYFSVVIPVYRAEGSLRQLCQSLEQTLTSITSNFEIILIEDCGGDESWDIISELAKKDPRIKGIRFSRNFGQHYGVTAGLDYCSGDWVAVMDCDMQDSPDEIPRLYNKALEGYDVVLAKREKRKDSLIRRFASWVFSKVFSFLSGMNYDHQVAGFRIISKKVVEQFRTMREQVRFFNGHVEWMGFPTASIDVKHSSRFEGESGYTFSKLLSLAMDAMIAYSDKPLRLSIKIGFAISFLSFSIGIYLACITLLYDSTVSGWASIMVSLFFIGGIIITNLGVIGIYLGKTYDETKNRPLYIVYEKIGL